MGYFLCVILVCGGKKSDNAGGKKSDNAGRKTAGEKDVTTEKIRIFILGIDIDVVLQI